MIFSTRARPFRVCLLALIPAAVSGRFQLVQPVQLLCEAGPVDLASRRSRQSLAQLDYLRHHVARQPLTAVIQHLLAGEVARAVGGHDRPEAIAENVIWYRQD